MVGLIKNKKIWIWPVLVLVVYFFLKFSGVLDNDLMHAHSQIEKKLREFIYEQMGEKTNLPKTWLNAELEKNSHLLKDRILPDGISVSSVGRAKSKEVGIKLVADLHGDLNETYKTMLEHATKIFYFAFDDSLVRGIWNVFIDQDISSVYIQWHLPAKKQPFQQFELTPIMTIKLTEGQYNKWKRKTTPESNILNYVRLEGGIIPTTNNGNGFYRLGEEVQLRDVTVSLQEWKMISDTLFVTYTIENKSNYKVKFNPAENLHVYSDSKLERFRPINYQKQKGYIASGQKIQLTTEYNVTSKPKNIAVFFTGLTYYQEEENMDHFLEKLTAPWLLH
ncbi:hypothetical protein [Bacillus kwashiorkori]|uniref:hypothetical protein n=1 Tax=Bacillus kwashiorkori TaxID=1522318 RepID=UPI0007816EBA|nr:hypothetical protein [Bacillus kwashiorkori]